MSDEIAGREISEEDLKNMSPEEIAELQKQNCIFCKIASKEIPAKIVHEDENTMCILDINPASEGHILVYPKKHYMILPHMPDDAIVSLFKSVKLMSHTLLKAMQCKGTTIFIANGVAAGQRAPHVLIHVFPRRENDGLVQLPKYEMNDEQMGKLKSVLRPYINQVFGKRVKDAEFVDKNNGATKKTEKDEDHRHKEAENKEHHKPEVGKTIKKDNKKSSDEKDKDDKSTKNIDLDDIARLFG